MPLTRQEYDDVFLNLRDKVIVIPPECIIIRLKDVLNIIEFFTEEDDERQKDNSVLPVKREGQEGTGESAG